MPPVPQLALTGTAITFGLRPLFRDLSVGVGRGERVCLVGRNGCGKSTLLKMLAGEIEPDAGERFVQPGIRVAYLPQETPVRNDLTVLAHVEDGLAPGHHGEIEMHRVEAVLDKLSLDGAQLIGDLSGGEARRAALARALVGEPDILLLDEPTNHLDVHTIEWLERYLADFPGGLLTISHDRAFLMRLSRRTLWLDRGVLRDLDAGYAKFEEWSDAILEEEEKALAKLEKRIETETYWLGRSITARRTRNEGRKRRLMEMRAQRAGWIGAAGSAKLAAAAEDSKSRLVIEAENINLTLPSGRTLVKDFSTRIMRGDRIGVIGRNGAGKTTLIRMLTGDLAPDSGKVKIAKSIHPAYFDQRRASLDPNKTLWQTLVPEGGDHVMVRGRAKHVVSYLRDFLFNENQAKSLVGGLSGGERNKLMLARTLAQPSNLLVLDEPTNDLDMDTLDLLQEVLAEYEGTLLIVSHDRDFLDRLVNGTMVMPGDGRVQEFAGGYSDYLRQRGEENGAPVKPAAAKRAPVPIEAKAPRARLSYKENRELETLPAEMAKLSKERDALEAKLADGSFYERDRAGFDAATRRIGEVRDALAAAEERWLELEMRREELAAGRS
jgi:ABC transport system ATP-binding/permease protein